MTPRKKAATPDIAPAAEETKTEASPLEALSFLNGILGKVAGSRSDHVAIQGAIGIVAKALDAEV